MRNDRLSCTRPARLPRLGLAIACVLGLSTLLPRSAPAQIDFGVRAGAYSDADEAFVGGEILGRLGGDWFYNPNAEWVFVDNGELVTLNFDFHYDFLHEGPADFWLGGGPALILRQREHGADQTDPGFDLLAGVGFNRGGTLRPYLQGKIILADDTEAVLAFGLRF